MRRLTLLLVLTVAGCDQATQPTPLPEEIAPPAQGTPILHPTDTPGILLDKAEQALGGPGWVAQWKCGHVKYETRSDTIVLPGDKANAIEEFFQLPGRLKRIALVGRGARQQTVTFILKDGEGWEYRPDGSNRLLPREAHIAALRSEHAFSDFCNLPRLRSARLSVVGEQEVRGQPCVVLHAEADFANPTDYAFDRVSALLVQTTKHLPQPTGPERTVETSLSDWRAAGAYRIPYRIVGRSEGKVLLDFTLLEIEFHDHFDDGVFAAP